jgi:hypothetical protein
LYVSCDKKRRLSAEKTKKIKDIYK